MRKNTISEVRLPRLFNPHSKQDIVAKLLPPTPSITVVPLPPSRSLSNPFLEKLPAKPDSSQGQTRSQFSSFSQDTRCQTMELLQEKTCCSSYKEQRRELLRQGREMMDRVKKMKKRCGQLLEANEEIGKWRQEWEGELCEVEGLMERCE